MRGGYQIVDLKNVNLMVGEPATIEGVYEALEGNYKKAVMVTGLTIDSSEVVDFFTVPYVALGNYVIKVTVGDINYTTTITADDEVTLTQG